MNVFELIWTGITTDELSYYVFIMLSAMFIIDLLIYTVIWFKLIIINKQVRSGLVYKTPLKSIVNEFEELIKVSTNEINTGAFIEDFFSRYKTAVVPFPLLNALRVPIIGALKFVKETVSLFILVGVMGTFIGIYSALVSVLNSGATDDILSGLSSLTPVLSAMGTAFATSIVGMGFALLTTFILKLFNAEQFLAGIMVRMENYLDNEIKLTQKSYDARVYDKLYKGMKSGFKELSHYMSLTYESVKGFKNFSNEFQQAAEHMKNFNTNLAGSMEDLKEFYETNREFTEGFSRDIEKLSSGFEDLFNSINNLSVQQKEVVDFLKENLKLQEETSAVLFELKNNTEKTDSILRQKALKIEEVFNKDSKRMRKMLTVINDTVNRQGETIESYNNLIEEVAVVREGLETSFDKSVQRMDRALQEVEKHYSENMNKNLKTFAEHVSISNNIIDNGFESLMDKFENMDSILASYLGGLSFNAVDLENSIQELLNSVKELRESVENNNKLFIEMHSVDKEG